MIVICETYLVLIVVGGVELQLPRSWSAISWTRFFSSSSWLTFHLLITPFPFIYSDLWRKILWETQ
ncbi:hypothetical protein Tsubulata_011799 [Turnera subulata]|uniref:Uncharacterized protein n=1 Tax=Turnera subulata TaxID=218843 RepID=A0A9Q0FUT1_9ROSI|nr:hypothetical protein Tsubulata_011799 [Turnera subulata]